ncbi:MAG: FHA domain-containing protein [Candidatus Aminicenantes bacterium]|nr:FHA domain-containing protein [Candidatus Aminicenantes bacterium]
MTIKKISIYFILVLLINYSQLISQDQTQKDIDKNQRIERFLYKYYTDDLQITDVIVKVDKELIAISGTPDFRNREKAIGQIVMAISGAGIAAPWTKDICITIQIQGMPLGFIEVPTRKAMLASEGKISPEAFISSFIATELSLPFEFPKDLLMPVIKSSEIWQEASIVECDATKIEDLLNVDARDFLPEFLQAAYIKTNPPDGSQESIAAVIDFENNEEAKDFSALNTKNLLNKKIYRIGTIIYIIKGPEEIVKKGIAALKPKSETKTSKKVSNIVKNFLSSRYIIIGAGFFVLFMIVIIIYIKSGKRSSRSGKNATNDSENNSLNVHDQPKVFNPVSALLVITNSKEKGKSFMITKEFTKIGRSGNRENDILIVDDTMSRQQATIIYDPAKDQFSLKNDSKSNPTILNKKIVSGSMILQHNDNLKMGKIRFVFKRNR